MPKLPGHLAIIAVGKMRTPHWLAAQADYLARLPHYCDVDLIEVRDAVGSGLPEAVAVQKEGERLLKAAADSQRLIALTPTGRHTTSENLAKFISQQLERYGRIAFLIGGPLGFAPGVTQAAHTQLALSYLTFPHELARVILLEQLYRAFTILNNEPYHK
jgi:23S rRNA (pseudouridine1915-N3)-methyltransferase